MRSAVRAARPTSSGRVFSPSSSSTTVSGITTSTSSNAVTHAGSAISTDVSSTIRVRVDRPASSRRLVIRRISASRRTEVGRRSVTATPWDRARLRGRNAGVADRVRQRRPVVSQPSAARWWMDTTTCTPGWRRGRDCPFCAIVAGDGDGRDRAPRRASPSPSSIARRCSPVTCSWYRPRHVVTLPDLADRRRAVLRARAARRGRGARGARRAGHVRRDEQRREPERPPPPRPRRAAHEGRRAARVLLAPHAVRAGRSGRGRRPLRDRCCRTRSC